MVGLFLFYHILVQFGWQQIHLQGIYSWQSACESLKNMKGRQLTPDVISDLSFMSCWLILRYTA
jgi:hypothetical protein